MAFLIGQMWPFLLLVLVFTAAAGWMWHLIQTEARRGDLELERRRLREELVSFVSGGGAPTQAEARASEIRRTREAVAESMHAQLQHAVSQMKAERDTHAARVGELERELERATARVLPAPVVVEDGRAVALETEVTRLTAALAQHPDESVLRQTSWRARYFEARTRYLEGEGRSAGASLAALAALSQERDAVRAEADVLRNAPPAEDTTALKWRMRYLDARNRYLEGGADTELKNRRAWRLRYLEARSSRLAHLLSPAPAGQTTDSEETRAKWRTHYLDQRVRHLEARLAATIAPPARAAEMASDEIPEAPPLVPAGAETRPSALPAPRHGAADDLTLIEGIGPKAEATLHALGVFHFDQVADWSRANIAWVDQYLRYRGRIIRENWVEQAQELAKGVHASRKLYFETETA